MPLVGLWLALYPPPDVLARYQALGLPHGVADLSAAWWEGTWPLLGSTLSLAAVVSAGAGLLGGSLAWIEHRIRIPGGRALSLLALLPLATPSYIVAASVQRGFGPGGWVGDMLGITDAPRGWPIAALVLVVVCAPYVHLLVGAALGRMSAAEEEAARQLGAGPWRRFRHLVLPQLRPTLAFSLLIVALYAVSDFGAVSVLDAPVLTWRIYQAQASLQIPQAVLAGFGVMGIVAPLLVLARLIHGRTGLAGPSVPNPRPPTPAAPGPLGVALCWALHLPVVGLGVVLPLVEMISWLSAGRPEAELLSPLAGTAALALAGAALTLALAFATGWVAARSPGRRTAALLDNSIFWVSALPGILVAFGLSMAAVWLPERLGQPPMRDALRHAGVLVMVGYIMRYLAEAHGGLKAAVLRLDPRLDESARALGANAPRRFWRVSLPLLGPAAMAGFLLVFLALIKELPVTLLVAPLGIRTLAYRVWERYTEGFLPDAAAAGLTLLALAMAAQLLTLRWRRHA